jgi:hypothetical protein
MRIPVFVSTGLSNCKIEFIFGAKYLYKNISIISEEYSKYMEGQDETKS